MEALDAISPKLVTLMIGTNHMHDAKAAYPPDEPNDIFSGIQAIVNEVAQRLPESKVIIFSVFSKKAGHGQRTGESGQCHAAPTCGWKTHRASGSQPAGSCPKKANSTKLFTRVIFCTSTIADTGHWQLRYNLFLKGMVCR